MIAAAIGLRTELNVQANRTAPGSSSPLGPRIASTPQMQHADEGKTPPRGVEIDLDLALEPFAQKCRALVVRGAARHVERLDLRRRRGTDRLEIAVADEEVVLDHAAERGQRQHHLAVRAVVHETDVEDKTVLLHRERQLVRSAVRARRREAVGLEKVVDRDLALLLDLARAVHDRALVERDRDEAEI